MVGWLMFAAIVTTGNVESASTPIDPSGTYATALGDLSILRGQRLLAFSYLAVFGTTAHICDGAGIAREVEPGRFVWDDENGSVTFRTDGDALKLELQGVAAFCGAGWPGDSAVCSAKQAPHRRPVAVDRAYFYTVGSDPPTPRKAYVIRGDSVEVVPALHGTGEGFVLGRFESPAATTVGLLREEDLAPAAIPQVHGVEAHRSSPGNATGR